MGSDELRTGIVRTELTQLNNGYARVLRDTVARFQDCVSFLSHVVVDHFEDMQYMDAKSALTYIEQLVHRTADNPDPEYGTFDILFYKLPSDYRRCAINTARGNVNSYDSNLRNYHVKRNAEILRRHHYKKREPKFSFTPNSCPCLYKRSYQLAGNTLRIKVFIRNTWDWIEVAISNRDLKSLQRAMLTGKVLNPRLVYKYNKFYLEFPVKYNVKDFPNTLLGHQRVLGVDLGFNHGAVCSLVDASGTVHKRSFSPFGTDTDRIDHLINLIKKYQSLSGRGQRVSSLYTKLQGLKENYTRQLARWIVNRAITCNAYGIVLENLSGIRGKSKRKRGTLKARVQHWCTAKIRDYIKGMAFREGNRVFLVNPNGTSKYAFDGSGPVMRDEHNHCRCTFVNGKQYDCDLSASYNIAARYFLRAYQKAMPATAWSQLKAKVPELSMRTRWTLSTLICVCQCSSKACAA